MKTKEPKTAVAKVELTIAGTTIKLTLEQFHELRKVINDLFPTETKTVVHEKVWQSPPIIIPQPIEVPARPYKRTTPYWEVTCNSNDKASSTLCIEARS